MNFGGSWSVRNQQLPDTSDLEFLSLLRQLINEFETRVRVRIEDPWMQVYAETEQDLLDFVSRIDYKFHNKIKAVSGPESEEKLELLAQGFTLRKKPQVYGYRVAVREGRYSKATKQQILTYLRNIGDEAQLPKHFIDNMERPFDSVWNCYFYVKDPGVLTMLSLISSGFIGRVEEFCVSPK